MPSYNRKIPVPGKTSQEIYTYLEIHLESLLQKFSMAKFDLKKEPHNKTVVLDSSMFSAKLICREGSVELDGKLSLMAAPFRSKIDEGIDRFLAKFRA